MEKADAAVFVYRGEINRSGYDQICKCIEQAKPRKTLRLVLRTNGGDPHAGYRIARARKSAGLFG